jgi:integrase
MLAMLIGCGLRRGELLALRIDSIQLREDRWVIADLLGKAGHSHDSDSRMGEGGDR